MEFDQRYHCEEYDEGNNPALHHPVSGILLEDTPEVERVENGGVKANADVSKQISIVGSHLATHSSRTCVR